MAAITETNFERYALSRKSLIEDRLKVYLQGNDPPELYESMRYSALSQGKRIRALLCLATAEAIASKQNDLSKEEASKRAIQIAMPCACAIELVHAMSLVHDDLPIMDNDDFRRGKPTNHKVFGEAMALLAGDGLLVLSSQILLANTHNVNPNSLIEVQLELSKAIGADGMIGGQVEDLKLTGQVKPIDIDDSDQSKKDTNSQIVSAPRLENLHNRKTGALLSFSAWSGAKLLEADNHELSLFKRFGQILGLAFQIADDLLDIKGNIATLGKTPGKDIANNKATWVTVFGEKASLKRLEELKEEVKVVLGQLCPVPNKSIAIEYISLLTDIFDFAVHRSS